ncbi:spore cortex biosynthesis protein YabQ [Bacillus timonensis]|nr:spore cortex biosynthesis protein YabQ [Bacillus timonensis]
MSLTTQFYTMIAMVGMGSWLGAALDTYGRFLKRPKRAHWVVFMNDILFWIIQGLIAFYILLMVNEGELRLYIFLALLCGYAAYQSLLRSWYMQFLERAIIFSISTYRFLTRTCYVLIVRPIQVLISFLISCFYAMLRLLLSIGKILYRVLLVLLKLLFTPFKWLGLLLWQLIPKKIQKFIINNFMHIAGFLKKAENMKHIMIKWWKRLRKR